MGRVGKPLEVVRVIPLVTPEPLRKRVPERPMEPMPVFPIPEKVPARR